MADGVQDIARFFDREACCSPRPPAGGRLRGVSSLLLELLDEAGVAGRTVLDAGCGQGGLALELSRRGATIVTGIDVSAASIAVARQAAQQAAGPVRFTVGDAAAGSLEPHDVVVLDKVVCCYFDAAGLVANTAPAARAVLALSLPHSRGPRGALARLLIGAENAWRRLRADPFQAYVHDVDSVARALTGQGFRLTARRDHWMWQAAVFERPSPAGRAG